MLASSLRHDKQVGYVISRLGASKKQAGAIALLAFVIRAFSTQLSLLMILATQLGAPVTDAQG